MRRLWITRHRSPATIGCTGVTCALWEAGGRGRLGDHLLARNRWRHARPRRGHLRVSSLRQPSGPSVGAVPPGRVAPRPHAVTAKRPGGEDSFADGHWVRVDGGHAVLDIVEDVIYLAIALRHAGSGIAVLHGWSFHPNRLVGDAGHTGPRRVPPPLAGHLRPRWRYRLLARRSPQTPQKRCSARRKLHGCSLLAWR